MKKQKNDERTVVSTGWPEVCDCLADELLEDPYVTRVLKGSGKDKKPAFTVGQKNAKNVMCVEWRPGDITGLEWTEAWMEARDEDAVALFEQLPRGERGNITVANTCGLELVQREMECTVRETCMFCMVDRDGFRPSTRQAARLLKRDDLGAMQRYPSSHNRDTFLRLFEEEKVMLFGSFIGDEIAAYCAADPKHHPGAVFCVHAREEHRRQGHGSSVVSACTAELLKTNEFAYYGAELRNGVGSLRLCLSLGYVPIRLEFYLEGRRRT